MKKTLKALVLLILTCLSSTLSAQDTATKPSTDSTAKKEKKMTIDSFVQKCSHHPGLFTVYRDTTTGKAYMLITKDQLDKEYIHFFHVENGSAAAGWVKGNYGWESLFMPERRYDHIRFIGQNSSFYYDPNNALSKAADANINKPVLFNAKIEVMNEKQDSFLIPADDLMKSEAMAQLKFSPPPGFNIKNPYKLGSLSSSKTTVDEVRNYPKNTDWLVTYVFENSHPTNFGLGTTTDARYNSVQVQHTLVAMPDNDYEVRYDDPRVGYFTTQVTDQTSKSVTPYRDMISRWHLVKKDPSAPLSEPVEPITYWMENSTPVELRPIIKKAVESWNIAFEAAGFKNAVVVKQQPDDADWDAGDLRYNVLRWTSAPYTGSAWGPSFVNPRTGQILGTDIMLDYIFVKGRTTYKELFDVSSQSIDDMMYAFEKQVESATHSHHLCRHTCEAGIQGQQGYMFGQTMATAIGYSEEEMGKMLEEYITELLLHEVGHTLGLNHNFKASHLWSPDQINDKETTSKVGLISSVMDYSAFNITGDPSTQGQYISTVPGPYDIWAITYGYQPSLDDDAAERSRMKALLDRSTEPELAFANDADDMRWPGKGIDPDVNIWDLTSDPLTYGEQRVKLASKTIGQLDQLLTSDEGYDAYMRGYNIAFYESVRALNAINRYVGGVRMDRAKYGQNGADKPLQPVSEAEQRRAMRILADYAFDPSALMASPDLLQRLVRSRRGFSHWGRTEDPKMHDMVLWMQRAMLAHLMHPTVHKRMTDSRLYGNTYEVHEMMADLTSAIFDQEVDDRQLSLNQQLQVTYTQQLIANLKGSRHDHVSKAAHLQQLQRIAKRYRKPSKDDAHGQYMKHIVDAAMKVHFGSAQ